nr:MAG TPA: hypothetical protein [Caudoviricetes sp.]
MKLVTRQINQLILIDDAKIRISFEICKLFNVYLLYFNLL